MLGIIINEAMQFSPLSIGGLMILLSRQIAATGFAALVLLFPHLAKAAGSAFDVALMSAMERMDIAMARAPMTGDVDRDFIAMMLPHHRGAVDMATTELAQGHDPRLRRLAQEIVVTQESEIQVMRAVRQDLATQAISKESK